MKDKTGKELSGKEVIQKGVNRLSNIYLDLKLMKLRWVGNIPFHYFRRAFYKLAGIKIGKGKNQ